MEQARIDIIEPNGVRRSLALGRRVVVIGRDAECEVVISYERASRRHAQVTFDGYSYYVTDLDSKNGTFLGKQRLQPNEPVEWTPETPLRIGDIYFNLDQPDYYERQREELGDQETITGFVPGQQQPPGESGSSRKWVLWLVIGGGLALCGCAALGGLAFLFLETT